MYLLVRNRVKDYGVWYTYFVSEKPAALEYGLTVEHLWSEENNPNNVFFLFAIESKEKALAFMDRPESVDVGEKSGVLDGEYYFLESAPTT